MGGRGSNSMDRLERGGRGKPKQLSNEQRLENANKAREKYGAETVMTAMYGEATIQYMIEQRMKQSKETREQAADHMWKSMVEDELKNFNEKAEEKRNAEKRLREIKERNDTTKMPWETDPKYSGRKNAKLTWLMDHPKSKYNNPDFIMGIKRIEAMSDRGVSAERRRKAFKDLAKQHGMTQREARNFIAPEFLK